MDEPHPLRVLLRDAAAGRFPPSDGTVRVVPPPPGSTDAVVAFTAHNVIATGVQPREVLRHLPSQDPGAPTSAEFIAWLAGRLGTQAGMLDQVMVAPPPDPADDVPSLIERDDLRDHPRLARSRLYRNDLRCYSDTEDRAIVILGKGLAERWEIAIDVKPEYRGAGLGKLLARASTRLSGDGELLFAQVSPGNVASVRAFLSAGYRPVCAEVLFLRPATS